MSKVWAVVIVALAVAIMLGLMLPDRRPPNPAGMIYTYHGQPIIKGDIK